jgi:hypothetical protein
MKFNELPPLGEQLGDGIFAGLTTKKDGTHCAVFRLLGKGYDLDWSEAKEWAEEKGGELPNRSISALLFTTVKEQLSPEWHWTSEERGDSYAWYCDFTYGSQHYFHKRNKGTAIAVRLIALED